MHKTLLALILTATLASCGGGDSAQPAQGTQFVVDYLLSTSSLFPAGTVQVSPPPGILQISDGQLAKVELLLFGYDKQVLTASNFSPKDNPQLRYVFRLPETFTEKSYPCGTGNFVSEVRLTTASGAVSSKMFEICPGTPLTVTAP